MNMQQELHNSHLQDPSQFGLLDPHLRKLQYQAYVNISPVLQQLPDQLPGIYTLGGGRQIGKTTLLKQWMQQLIQKGVPPKAIFFFTGEMIDDHHVLLNQLQACLKAMPKNHLNFIILDEVSYIQNWDKGIKFAADAGLLENTILMLSGSDLTLLKEARMTFPGRRGSADKKDFHVYPLSFREFLQLTKRVKNLDQYLESVINLEELNLSALYAEFNQYLQHGGFLTAINNLAKHSKIELATLETYSDWVRGDVLKRGKQDRYLQEIFSGIIKRYGAQITWPSIAADLSIDHPNTVADYCHLLEAMDVIFIQYALIEDKLLGAPKKARKIIFSDPFIYHAINNWLKPTQEPFIQQIIPNTQDAVISSGLVEACVTAHFRRLYPTYYIKAEGEVDVAYVNKNKFWPVEVKWTTQLRPKDLKQISKYKNSIVYAKTNVESTLNGVAITPLPLALLRRF